jgi:Uncharacterized conserved protein
MAGHSKWSKVKRFKGAIDAKRGKIFSKLSKEISLAAKTGGGDPGANPRLRSATLAARAQSMPNDNIDRAIKRGTGEGKDGEQLDEITYEGYAPGGVAIIVETAQTIETARERKCGEFSPRTTATSPRVAASRTCSTERTDHVRAQH